MPLLVDITSYLLFLRQPAKTPVNMPMPVAMIVPVPTRTTVGQMRSLTTSETGRFSEKDMPKRPWIVSPQ